MRDPRRGPVWQEEAVELAEEAAVDPEDVAEAEAGEDLVVAGPGARISRISPQLEHILNDCMVNVASQ